MSKLIILEVPFNEKDEVKLLGAKWDVKIKKWYIPENMDKEKFQKWIPKMLDTPVLVAKAPVYLLKSWEYCWRCDTKVNVFCLAASGAKEEWDEEVKFFYFFFSNIYT